MEQCHDLEKQPAILTKHLNRRLSVKNSGLNKNWSKQLSDIERHQSNQESKLDSEISKVLNYRNSLTEKTGKFSETQPFILPSLTFEPPSRKVSFSNTSGDVFHHEDRNNNLKVNQFQKMKHTRNRLDSLTKETTSFENKRINRRKSSFSLLELQQMISQQSENPMVDLNQPATIEKIHSNFDSPKSNHLWLEEGEMLPVKLPPLAHVWTLPKIYNQVSKNVETRNFERDDTFLERATGKDADYSDMKFCRYLRVPQRKNSRRRSNTN